MANATQSTPHPFLAAAKTYAAAHGVPIGDAVAAVAQANPELQRDCVAQANSYRSPASTPQAHPFRAAVKAHATAHRCTIGDAVEAVALSQPQLHGDYIAQANTNLT